MGWTIYYHTENGRAEILRCLGDGSPLMIPASIDGCPVTSLGADCFGAGHGDGTDRLISVETETLPPVSRETGNLCRITLPDSIDHIGDRAFARCRELKRLTLPGGLKTMGLRIFDQCGGLERLTVPEGVTELPPYAFSQCRKLERLTLPSGLVKIGDYAFYNCVALTALEFPDQVKTVGEAMFMNCRSLSRLSVPIGVNLSVLVADLSNDLDMTIRYPDGIARLFLPGFSYEYEDINAPRMWRTITYGSGQLYRECFSSRDVDYQLYEDYFFQARLEDKLEDTVRIAWYRLRWPYRLGHGREKYLDHIIQNQDQLLKLLLKEDDLEGLELMLELIPPAETDADELLALAERSGRVRFVGRLLEARSTLAGGADKEFNL